MLDIPDRLLDLVLEYNRTFPEAMLDTERAPDNFPSAKLEKLLRDAIASKTPIDKEVLAVSNPDDQC